MNSTVYWERLARLREKKLAQTQEKLEYEGYLDEDDYGRVVPTFSWSIIPNDPDGNFYGIDGWTENFCDLMEKHATYIDPDDAFTGKWMYFMSKMRPYKYKEQLLPKSLKRSIELYKLDAGIGFDAHFCPDYKMGLSLGWGGLLKKIGKYKAIHPDKSHFYECHAEVIKSIQVWIQHHIEALAKLEEETDDLELRNEYRVKLETNKAVKDDPPPPIAKCSNGSSGIIWLQGPSIGMVLAGNLIHCCSHIMNDVKAGRITRDEAVYQMGCFLINDPVYWQIGGPDKDGKDQSCEMSYIILDAAEKSMLL